MTFTLNIKTPAQLAAEARDRAREAIKARRDRAIASGLTVGGISVATDDISQGRITGAALQAVIDPTYTVQWKAGGGFVTLSAEQVIGVAQAIRAHVQACFDNEAKLLALLTAGEDYDVESGWPRA
jgi:hypothetical protein